MATRDHMDLGLLYLHPRRRGRRPPLPHQEPRSGRATPQDRRPLHHRHPLAELPFRARTATFRKSPLRGPLHPVLVNPDAADGRVRFLPSHPHEGDISAPPDDPSARVIATGRSLVTAEPFNIAVAFEASDAGGRAIAQSTFHHFADYNWDPSRGKPSFVVEPPGEALRHSAKAQQSIRKYMKNLALWLVGANPEAEHEAA